MDGGAALAGGRADALVTIAEDEMRRRDAFGIGAVTDLALLDLFLSLPLGHPMAWSALTTQERAGGCGLRQKAQSWSTRGW